MQLNSYNWQEGRKATSVNKFIKREIYNSKTAYKKRQNYFYLKYFDNYLIKYFMFPTTVIKTFCKNATLYIERIDISQLSISNISDNLL